MKAISRSWRSQSWNHTDWSRPEEVKLFTPADRPAKNNRSQKDRAAADATANSVFTPSAKTWLLKMVCYYRRSKQWLPLATTENKEKSSFTPWQQRWLRGVFFWTLAKNPLHPFGCLFSCNQEKMVIFFVTVYLSVSLKIIDCAAIFLPNLLTQPIRNGGSKNGSRKKLDWHASDLDNQGLMQDTKPVKICLKT